MNRTLVAQRSIVAMQLGHGVSSSRYDNRIGAFDAAGVPEKISAARIKLTFARGLSRAKIA
jgi:hypothetical protein